MVYESQRDFMAIEPFNRLAIFKDGNITRLRFLTAVLLSLTIMDLT